MHCVRACKNSPILSLPCASLADGGHNQQPAGSWSVPIALSEPATNGGMTDPPLEQFADGFRDYSLADYELDVLHLALFVPWENFLSLTTKGTLLTYGEAGRHNYLHVCVLTSPTFAL